MKTSQKAISVIYLDKQRLDYYGGNISDKIIHLDFPPNIIKNQEIVKKDELKILIKAFIDFYKILPAKAVIILSKNICFEKVITTNPDNPISIEVQKFVDTVPFENICYKLFDLEAKAKKIVAVNKDLIEGIKAAFEKHKFLIETVVPEFTIGKEVSLKNTFDQETARLTLERHDNLKANNLLDQQTVLPLQNDVKSPNDEKSGNRSSLIFLVPVFLVLLTILFFLYQKNLSQSSSTLKRLILSPTPILITPTISAGNKISLEKLASPSAFFLAEKNIRLKIVNGSGIKGYEEKLKNRLINLGIKNIDTEENNNINTSQTLILVSDSLSPSIGENIIREINQFFQNISIQETTRPDFDITIIIGKAI